MDDIAARVGIIGGGFGGLRAARTLAKYANIHVTIIDSRNHHLFQPLLYQVATANLSPAEIATPIRSILSRYPNVDVVLDVIDRIDVAGVRAFSKSKEYQFDYLIVACGASHSYFGHEEWEEFAPGLKTVEQATEIRARILLAYEEAEKLTSVDEQRAFLTFVVVGGGPTGVELAGSIAELGKITLSSDFRNIEPERTRVLIIEAGPRLLNGFDPALSKQAVRDLEKLGVQVWTNSRVTGISKEGVSVGKDFIASHTVLWAAGVETNPLARHMGEPLDRLGRVKVKKDLSLNLHSNVFVIGDMAAVENEEGQFLPGLAPVAMQEGSHVAQNIIRELRGQDRQDFHYSDKGMMATIGRKKAVIQMGRVRLHGLLAWLTWLFIHVFYLVGFRNRLFVVTQWAWSYFTFKRGARLIVSHDWKSSAKVSTAS